MKRNVYLQTVDLYDVPAILERIVTRIEFTNKIITISPKDSLNYVTATPVHSTVTAPNYAASAMDGFMVRSIDTMDASETNPVILKKPNFKEVNTGNMIQYPFDAVIMIEDVQYQDDQIGIIQSVSPYQHIRTIGENLLQNSVIIPKYHQIRAIDISAMITGLVTEISVFKPLEICIVPTGDEIVSNPSEMTQNSIIDSNSYYIKNECQDLPVNVDIHPVIPDEYDTIRNTVALLSTKYDIIIIGAGSSAGDKDFTKHVVDELGEVDVHGVNIKPGKPVVIGSVNRSFVFGMPGYPVSTYIITKYILKPFLSRLLHIPKLPTESLSVRMGTLVYSSLKNHEYVRVVVGQVHGAYTAYPLSRKSAVTTSVVQADAILNIPKHSEGFKVNELVEVELLRPLRKIEQQILVIGSHDILFDILQHHLLDKGLYVQSIHVGSFGGVMAQKNKASHISPVHVLDSDGTYNKSLISKYLTDDYCLVSGLFRQQGLYVKEGNPKNIHHITDITKPSISFVNRQPGSGTRVLFDYLLSKHQIFPEQITGYDYEAINHSQVASSVSTDTFDVGLGIQSVCTMYGLEFIPIQQESYDFIVSKEFYQTEQCKMFFEELKSEPFQQELNRIGGYQMKDNCFDVL